MLSGRCPAKVIGGRGRSASPVNARTTHGFVVHCLKARPAADGPL